MILQKRFYSSVITLVVFGLLFAPTVSGNLWLREAVNSGHVVLFFFLSFVLYSYVQVKTPDSSLLAQCFYVLVAGLLLGVVIEMLQILVQREASLNDLYKNAAGIMACLCLLAALKIFRKKQIIALFLLLASVSFVFVGLMPLTRLSVHYFERYNAFPVIIDFDSNWSNSFLRYSEGSYPGVSVIETEPDWLGYTKLRLNINSVAGHGLKLVLRVHDKRHNQNLSDRFNVELSVSPGENTFKILLDDIKQGPSDRELDLKNIEGLIVFSTQLEEWRKVEVRSVFLE